MSILNLDARQLMVFYYAANEENLSLAAEKLCITQPTVTYHLKALEEYAGAKLFIIKKQKVFLTETGQGLFQHVQELWTQLNYINKYLETFKKNHIRIAITPLFDGFMSHVLSKFWELHSEITFEIVSALSPSVVQKVSDLDVDVGIVMTVEYGEHKVILMRVSDNERLVFVASPQVSLAKRDKVDWRDLMNEKIICGPQGSPLHQLIINNFLAAGIQSNPKFMLNTTNIELIKPFIMGGNCIGLYHIKSVESELYGNKLTILPLSNEITVPMDVVINQNTQIMKPIVEEFVKFIKKNHLVS